MMINIGVKFCGGCNPGYDRRDAYEQIKRKLAGSPVVFSHVEEGINYDLLLVIEGCANRCAHTEKYEYEKIIHVWNLDTADDAVRDIKNIIEKLNQEVKSFGLEKDL